MSEPDRKDRQEAMPEESPPLFGTWGRLYLLVIAWLGFLIVLFYLFSRRFAP